jgi:hypothetical protein
MTTGIAVYSACRPCATELELIGEEYEPGRIMGIGHAHHAPELAAAGWAITYPDGPDKPADVVCPHYPALCQAGP